MKQSRRRLATILGLFAGSLFCIALVVVRNVHTGNVNFRYLIWNLFLAWIPFALAVFVYDRWRRRRGGVLLVTLGALWLLFFPNAPYIATDFVHLQRDPLSGPQDARTGRPRSPRRGDSPRRRERSRRQRGDLPPRSGSQRHRALSRSAAGGLAASGGR